MKDYKRYAVVADETSTPIPLFEPTPSLLNSLGSGGEGEFAWCLKPPLRQRAIPMPPVIWAIAARSALGCRSPTLGGWKPVISTVGCGETLALLPYLPDSSWKARLGRHTEWQSTPVILACENPMDKKKP
ncbi:hypothetical protein KIN20_024711 [Parelaphostrongylus tenuis]|uniref:Uncharacterized protein n=1 Tax=Parelaphostrongylus tenuis TaxID=148309 RepID=A0AAD5NCY8_PARTN|nr:hypothetical protein KIN20_024711 [Parelaphostrongylus tenuis]